jgi:hypothetical protein
MKRTKASKKRINKKKHRLDKNRPASFDYSSENEEIVIETPNNIQENQEEKTEPKKEVKFSENIKSIDDNIFENTRSGIKLRINGNELTVDNRLFIFRMLSSDNRWKVLEFIKEIHDLASDDHKQKIQKLLNVLRDTTYSSDSKWVLKSLEIC